MKIRTNLKAGSLSEAGDDRQSGFLATAGQQASSVVATLGNTVGALQQGFSDLLGLS